MDRRCSLATMLAVSLLAGTTAALTASDAEARRGIRMGKSSGTVIPVFRSGGSSAASGDTSAKSLSPEESERRTAAGIERAQKTLAAERAIIPATADTPVSPAASGIVCVAGCYGRP